MFVSAVVNSYETRLPGWLDWIINNATRIQDHASWLIEWSSTDQRLKEDSHYRFRARITKIATIHIILARKEYWRETSTRCRLCREELASYSDCASSLIAQNASSLFGSQQKQDVLRSWVSMHQHCAPLHNPKISYTMNWMLLLATFPKQNNCTYLEILMQEWEPIMTHGLHVLDTMAWGKWTKMDRYVLSCAAIMDCQSQTHYLRINRVTKCPGDFAGRVIGINLIL